MCVINATGQALIALNDLETYVEELELYTNNYRIRFAEVLETAKMIQSSKAVLDAFLSGQPDVTSKDAKKAYDFLESLDPDMKRFESIEFAIAFPVRRISRLNELTTIDIVKEYGIALSRIGHPFDFSGDIPIQEKGKKM